MDSLLITLLIVAVAVLSNWLQRRAQSGQENPDGTGRSKPPSPPPRTRRSATPPVAPSPTLESSLERELRRLLGEEPPQPTVHTPRPQPPPLIAPTPPPVARRTVPPPPPPPPPAASPAAAVIVAAAMPQSRQPGIGYGQAEHLHESVALRLRQIDVQTDKHAPGQMRPPPLVSTPGRGLSLAALSHNPQAVRQAFIASLIFGEPKGL